MLVWPTRRLQTAIHRQCSALSRRIVAQCTAVTRHMAMLHAAFFHSLTGPVHQAALPSKCPSALPPCILNPQPRAITAVLLSFPSHSYRQYFPYRIPSRTQTMNAPQPSISELELLPSCNSCQYCPSCEPKKGAERRKLRFCQHGRGRAFVDRGASGHDCPGPEPYTTGSAYTHSNNPAGQHPRQRDGGHDQPRVNRSSQHGDADNAWKRDIYKDMEADGDAQTHLGGDYETESQFRGGTTYSGMKFSGKSITHVGDNVGYKKTETERLAEIDRERSERRDGGH